MFCHSAISKHINQSTFATNSLGGAERGSTSRRASLIAVRNSIISRHNLVSPCIDSMCMAACSRPSLWDSTRPSSGRILLPTGRLKLIPRRHSIPYSTPSVLKASRSLPSSRPPIHLVLSSFIYAMSLNYRHRGDSRSSRVLNGRIYS